MSVLNPVLNPVARIHQGLKHFRMMNVLRNLPAVLIFLSGKAGFAVSPAELPRIAISDVRHVPAEVRSQVPVQVTAKVSPTAKSAFLEYQLVDPGRYIERNETAFKANWVTVPMNDQGVDGDARAGDGVFTVTLPGSLQLHRRLVRYRILAVDAQSRTNRSPAADDEVPNFAYFVYDGIPAWRGAIDPGTRDARRNAPVEFGTEVMRSVPAYHLIGSRQSIENVTWREQTGGRDYKYTGTMVFDGRVYDHIHYRARGGVWRYAMGKNMWKFDFNKGHPLEARDDYGRPYSVPWSKLNLRACIDQGDYGMRGNQGLFEAVGFRLFNLAGVESPATHWRQLRIIDDLEENPRDQYRGDFWGLYLAIENEDGRFLKQHGLPEGNLFKMEGGDGRLQFHAPNAVTNKSDLHGFMSSYRQNPPEAWWRANTDLPRYYSYRSIIEAIHHYDCDEGAGKNYDFYFNPVNQRWQAVPWDIDLTWADHMFGGGDEPFRGRVLSKPVFQIEYQNRLREIRDLLYNPVETGRLIDECAAIISGAPGGRSIVEADRAKWDYHPVMARGGKAGQGLFYRAAATKDFVGMARLMTDYVSTRGRWIDDTLLRDEKIPASPVVKYTGPERFPASQLTFRAGEFRGSAAFAAMKWRLAEIAPPQVKGATLTAPGKYEIMPAWESAELTTQVPDITLPVNVVTAGHTYRLRVRFKDVTERRSHWSQPVEFTAGR